MGPGKVLPSHKNMLTCQKKLPPNEPEAHLESWGEYYSTTDARRRQEERWKGR